MGRRLTKHRLTPRISDATRAKRQIERINKLISRAKNSGDVATLHRLDDEKHWAIINSIPR